MPRFVLLLVMTSHLTTKKRSGPARGEEGNFIMFTHPGIHCAVNVESRYYKLAWESAGAKAAFLVIGNLSTDRKGAYPLCAYCGNVVAYRCYCGNEKPGDEC